MAGIYIHIPFCRQACTYCNFHFSTTLSNKDKILSAILNEIDLRRGYLGGDTVETIYFGGGTPSLLSHEELSSIMDALRPFPISADPEITCEANPDDITETNIRTWKELGFNRLSIGIQSFFDEDLTWMNRAHNASQALASIQKARDGGISDLSIDLIYGFPALSDQRWMQNIQTAISLKIPHLSCYALTVEARTALANQILNKKTAAMNDQQQASQFMTLMEILPKSGYEHYEISNFALPGKRSRHNSSYWQGKKYLGIGPAAHSFNETSRQWNPSNNQTYAQSLDQDQIPAQIEVLTPIQQINEYIMTALRTSEGIDLQLVGSKFGERRAESIESNAAQFIESQKMIKEDKRLILTNQGRLFADSITADLFYDNGPSG